MIDCAGSAYGHLKNDAIELICWKYSNLRPDYPPYPCRLSLMSMWIAEPGDTRGRFLFYTCKYTPGTISSQSESHTDGISSLRTMFIKRVLTASKEYWKEDGNLRWTSSWTNCPPRPSGHIYPFELVWPGKIIYPKE